MTNLISEYQQYQDAPVYEQLDEKNAWVCDDIEVIEMEWTWLLVTEQDTASPRYRSFAF